MVAVAGFSQTTLLKVEVESTVTKQMGTSGAAELRIFNVDGSLRQFPFAALTEMLPFSPLVITVMELPVELPVQPFGSVQM